MQHPVLEVRLEGPDDIHSALELLSTGQTIVVSAGSFEQRPKSWLIHELVQRSCAGGATVHDPKWVSKGVIRRRPYMRSCLLKPARDGPDDPTGVREPRRPKPSTPGRAAAEELPW